MQPYKILVKYPSRGRKERFFKSLDSCIDTISDKQNYHISCTLDEDDFVMNNSEVIDKIACYENVSIAWGKSESKVNAVNRNMPDYDYDIVVVHSDDILFTYFGWDEVVRQAFGDNLDQLIHIPDNDAKDILAIMYIAGKPFYERMGYIYSPKFKSLFCDNHIQDIAKLLGKYKYVDCKGMIFHANAAYGHMEKDSMFIEQQEIGWSEDQRTYNMERARNYDIHLLKK